MRSIVQVGDVLAGRYRVERVLGMGGMGVVFAATHVHLDQEFAIKLLLPSLMGHRDSLARFLREAKAAARIKSRHAARVFDFGTLDDGAPFIAMELLDGVSASAMLRHGGKLEPEVAAEYVLQACEAVNEAHAAGIIHRDLKPANLFICLEPNGSALVKVLDFGVSKVSGTEACDVSTTASLLGSPSYMAPEQVTSAKTVDGQADVWSLGAVLYEFVTGEKAFQAENIPALCMLIMNSEPKRPSELVEGLPAELEGIILRCLRKEKSERYAAISELADALAGFLGRARGDVAAATRRPFDASILKRPAPVVGDTTVVDSARPSEATSAGIVSYGTRPQQRLSWRFGVLAVVLSVVGASVIAWGWARRTVTDVPRSASVVDGASATTPDAAPGAAPEPSAEPPRVDAASAAPAPTSSAESATAESSASASAPRRAPRPRPGPDKAPPRAAKRSELEDDRK